MKIIAGSSNVPLAQNIADLLDTDLANAKFDQFSDGESCVYIRENIRGKDVFLIQSTSNPVNHHLMEMLIALDALKRSSARRITVVMPYFGYARQDAKSESRTPITAKLVANLLTQAGADRVLTLDLHSRQTQGFFDIPCDNLFGQKTIAEDIKKNFNVNDLLIVSPDVGGVVRARALANVFDAPLAIVDKRRDKVNESEVMNVIGDVGGKDCIIVDDIADTAGTLVHAAKALKDMGAKSVFAYVTHGVLSGPAYERINKSEDLNGVVITDTINKTPATLPNKVRTISIARLLSKAIKRIHNEESISELFK